MSAWACVTRCIQHQNSILIQRPNESESDLTTKNYTACYTLTLYLRHTNGSQHVHKLNVTSQLATKLSEVVIRLHVTKGFRDPSLCAEPNTSQYLNTWETYHSKIMYDRKSAKQDELQTCMSTGHQFTPVNTSTLLLIGLHTPPRYKRNLKWLLDAESALQI